MTHLPSAAARLAAALALAGAPIVACGSEGPADASDCERLSGPPYPASRLLAGITWDFANLTTLARGSDLWPTTWGRDGDIYTSWGDGGGFGGTDVDGRVSLGFGKISGPPTAPVGRNLWGGKDALRPATLRGKATGMVSVGGVLYAWVLQDKGLPPDVRLAWSENLGLDWQQTEWRFPGRVGAFWPAGFLNFGRDNAGARDEFVYVYGKRWSAGGDPFVSNDSFLARVPAGRLRDRSAYEFFAGLDATCRSSWTSDIDSAKPVLSDPEGVDTPGVHWNAALRRYLATTARGGQVQKLAVLEGPEPWGPWFLVASYKDWGGFGSSGSLGFSIPIKWISADGLTIWLVFSASGTLDSFNLIQGRLKPASP